MDPQQRVSHKPDIDSTLIKVIIYMVVLNAPFLGLYKNLLTGSLDKEYYPFLAVGIFCLGISAYFSGKFFSIRFGWDENGVFKQGVFRYTHIPWIEIRKIYETGAAQEWSEGDMLFMKGKNSGRKVFVIESAEKKIVLEFYRPMVGFKKEIAERLNLKIGDNYNAVWNFILNG